MPKESLSTTIEQPIISVSQGPVIQIGQMEAFISIIVFLVSLGIAWGKLTTKIGYIASTIKDKIEPDLKDVRERFASLEGKSSHLFASASPISLLDKGIETLNNSGLKKYIEDNKESLLKSFKDICVMNNQYDIQEQAFKFFDELDFKDFESNLKKASFDYGISIATLRRIGGIYFRDIALKKANFTPQDLDK